MDLGNLNMTNILLGIISTLIAILLGIVAWGVSRIEKSIDLKQDKKVCDEKHGQISDDSEKLWGHKHAPVDVRNGKGGEVIIPR